MQLLMARVVRPVQGCAPYDIVLIQAEGEMYREVVESKYCLGASVHEGALFSTRYELQTVRVKVPSSHASTIPLMMLIWGLNQVVVGHRLYKRMSNVTYVVLGTASKVVMQAADLERDAPTPESDVNCTLITGGVC
jgi:hypothetical protein